VARVRIGGLVLLASAAALAQDKPSAFDVAEIKVNTNGGPRSRVTLSNGRFIGTNVPLRPLIAEAWTTTPDGVIGPGWLDDIRVDIAAKAASPEVPDAQVRLMVRSLLTDRMKLAAHTDNREQRVFALTVRKGKPNLTPSRPARTAEEEDCSLERRDGAIHAACRHITMARFAHELPELAGTWIRESSTRHVSMAPGTSVSSGLRSRNWIPTGA
jgi:uncharacterized protein (TIGR03435 family)